ncbi:pyridoxal phosphate-dependent transferase [Stachybotrys elegans]|uniref:Pyridoxal phosphate-dependent transferase n=1 Tax=Stachybotrys elegans TaxID=80388 RepID=A0A8K0SYV7_9HYPO|nr:pyridoxal phosphate-dependent transferase [Stachybotrys elegans]
MPPHPTRHPQQRLFTMQVRMPSLQSELDQVSSSLASLVQRLLSTTQDVADDPIIKVAQASDVTTLKEMAAPGPARSVDHVIEEAFAIFDHRMRVNHPRFMGFIPSPTSPIAWLGDCIASAFNALGASKLQSSGPVVIEKTLIEWLATKIGFPSTAGGICVSGGSMANLMSIILARDRGVRRGQELRAVAYLSDQTHYSVAKALRFLGFNKDQVRRLPADESFRLCPERLKKAIEDDREAGLVPFLVVATCGTTNTGAVDPLEAISEICQQQNIWMHVDGAYGASAALSASRAEAVSGLKYADSVSWDAHKWLFQTYSCGLLLVKDKSYMVKSFANEGDYLRDGVAIEDEDIPNFWNYSMELTRPASRAMKLWFTLRVLGVDRIGRMLDHGFDLAGRAEEELRRLEDWEVTSAASMAVVTFRYAPPNLTETQRDELNTAISRSLIASNTAGILTTVVKGKVSLRICALSPHLSLDEMGGIVIETDRLAKELARSISS